LKELLKSLSKKDVFLIFVCTCLTIIQTVFDMFQIMSIKSVMEFVGKGDLDLLFMMLGMMLAMAFLSLIFGCFSAIVSTKIGISFGLKLRQKFFMKVNRLSSTDIDAFSISSLITRMSNDITNIQTTTIMVLTIIVRAMCLFVGGIATSFMILVDFGYILLGITSLIVILMTIFFFKIGPYYYRQQVANDGVNQNMRENLLGIKIVKIFNIEKHQQIGFDKVNKNLSKRNMQAQIMTMAILPFLLIFLNLMIVILFWTTPIGNANPNYATSIASVIAISSLVLISILVIFNILISILKSQASLMRVKEVFQKQSAIKFIEDQSKVEIEEIEFKNVSFKYNKNQDWILKNMSFKLKKGESVGIIGPSGSGKTTLICLMTRLYEIDKGHINFNNKDIKDFSLNQLQENISISPQKSIIFSGTVETNLKFGNENATTKELMNSLKEASADEFIKSVKALQTVVEQRGNNFSGGQKQRLSIARALIKNSNILILDDSTSALDMLTEKNVCDNIEKNHVNKIKILVAQRINAIKDCNQIFVLKDGEILATGTHKELIKNCEYYYDIVKNQGGVLGVQNED